MTDTPKGTRLSRIGTWSAALGLLLMAFSAGHKLGFLASWAAAFGALALGALLMFVALVTSGLGLLRSGGTAGAASRTATWLALVASLVVSIISVNGMRSMGGPPIHDISTDTVDPPAFVDVVPLRQAANAANPPQYAGAEDAAMQAEAYPDIQTIVLDMPAAEAFARAEAAARAMGWDMVAVAPAEGRIEATASTSWIGFKDDVVIRVAAAGNGSRIDVRSKSRVGKGDAGMNARRIREFRARLAGG